MVSILPDGRKARGLRGATMAVAGAAGVAAVAGAAGVAAVAGAAGVAAVAGAAGVGATGAGARSAVSLPAGAACDA